MSNVMTVRVETDVKQRLEKLAKATARTKSFLAAEAIRAYLDLNEWQVSEIEAGLREADAELFASDEEVTTELSKKWRRGDR
jgi:RHH-type transcriptional regulator, rel operon repressor / antitoxin RelB